MNKTAVFILTLIFLASSIALSAAPLSNKSRGAVLFAKHCTACHPDAARIKPNVNIVKFMRDPVPPMPSFRSDKISDEDAQSIAAFINVRMYCARVTPPEKFPTAKDR